MHNALTRVLAYLLLAAPPALCLWYINKFGVDVPYWDQWYSLMRIKEVYEGTANWLGILGEQWNQHQTGVLHLMIIDLAKLTHYNVKAEMFANWGFMVLSFFALLKIARNNLPERITYAVAMIPISVLVFSLRQYEILLNGLQVLSLSFFVITICCLDCTNKHKYWFVGLAILSGLCSTFSSGSGFLVWPLGGLQILLKNLWNANSSKSFKPLIIWLTMTAAVMCYFFCFYKSAYLLNNPYGLTAAMLLNRSWDVICFFLAYLVSPLVATFNENIGANSYPDIVVSQGLALAGIYAAICFLALREPLKSRRKLIAPVMMMLYAILSGFLITLSRVGGGCNQALASRYVCFSCLGIIGAYLVLLTVNNISTNIRAFLLGVLLVPVFASTIMCTKVGLEEGQRMRTQRLLLSYFVLSYKQQDPRMFPLLKLPKNFVELASFLEKNHLGVFRKPHPDWHIPRVQPAPALIR